MYVCCVCVCVQLGMPLTLWARLAQARTNARLETCGELSAVPFVLGLVGSLLRIGSARKQLKEPLAVLAFAASALVNGLIVAQIIYYR